MYQVKDLNVAARRRCSYDDVCHAIMLGYDAVLDMDMDTGISAGCGLYLSIVLNLNHLRHV